jgi:hypothetical protein
VKPALAVVVDDLVLARLCVVMVVRVCDERVRTFRKPESGHSSILLIERAQDCSVAPRLFELGSRKDAGDPSESEIAERPPETLGFHHASGRF